jgi:acetylornithine deacetylase/succinyl-diaminopimelate desuccinylase-like protein
MDPTRDRALKQLRSRREQDLSLLREFLRIPSVSTEAQRQADVLRAADWLAEALRTLSMDRVEILPTGGHPVVFAETRRPGPEAQRVLVYGHYDVQPVDPLELWDHDPFEPATEGEHLVGRGASDMKGQIIAVLAAVAAFLREVEPRLQLKFLFEGEEEIGSPHLLEFLGAHKEDLEAELCLNPDTGMMGPELPTITYGLRGLAYFELRLHGPAQDLHSGAFGGVVHNPAQALCELVAGMHDRAGRVTLPGFYDSVRPLSPEERRHMDELPTNEAFYRRNAGVSMLWGEEGFTAAERVGARPTLEVNGLLSGFTGQGSKTVLPAAAMAKLSMRLVPDQDPGSVEGQLRQYLEGRVPPTIRWELERLAAAPPSLSDRDSDGVRALSAALESVWKRPALFRREGGSVPVTAYLQEMLGMESVLTGFALPDDNAHSPNERLHLPTWERGCEAVLHFLCNLNETGAGTIQDPQGGNE